MVRLYEGRAQKKGLKFESSIKIPKKAQFTGKAIQFEQVVSTILDNAIKYTDHGKVELKISVSPKLLKAEIFDTGSGIPKKEREAIFERFNRLSQGNKSVQGLGLGLYMARKIIDELKGKIHVEDNPKAKTGTKFIVKIPR
jgi:signal transduction histidine kinase